jgi:hypothetical protein
MNWEALGAIGEVVGAIAVVLTLGYLAVQIRQNTKSVRSSTRHAFIASGGAIQIAFAEAEAAAVLVKGGRAYSDLSLEQRFQFTMLMRAVFGVGEDSFLQAGEGLLDRELWEARARIITETLSQPGMEDWWKNNRHIYSKGFQEAVAKLLDASRATSREGT